MLDSVSFLSPSQTFHLFLLPSFLSSPSFPLLRGPYLYKILFGLKHRDKEFSPPPCKALAQGSRSSAPELTTAVVRFSEVGPYEQGPSWMYSFTPGSHIQIFVWFTFSSVSWQGKVFLPSYPCLKGGITSSQRGDKFNRVSSESRTATQTPV